MVGNRLICDRQKGWTIHHEWIRGNLWKIALWRLSLGDVLQDCKKFWVLKSRPWPCEIIQELPTALESFNLGTTLHLSWQWMRAVGIIKQNKAEKGTGPPTNFHKAKRCCYKFDQIKNTVFQLIDRWSSMFHSFFPWWNQQGFVLWGHVLVNAKKTMQIVVFEGWMHKTW